MTQKKFFPKTVLNIHRWAFLVGVNQYDDSSISPLSCCVADAQALKDLLLSHPEHGYAEGRTRLLISTQEQALPTRRMILKALAEMASQTNKSDLLLFYFSGHGVVIDGAAYLVVQDSETGALLQDTAISLKRIKTIMRGAAARAKVLILDACHLGVPLQGRSMSLLSRDFIKSVFEEAEGIAVLAASAMDQRAWEDSRKGHGVFTYYLLEGLRGAADTQPDRRITLYEISNYVKENVEVWARENLLEEAQRPTLDFQGSGEPVLLMTPTSVVDTTDPIAATQYSPLAATFPEAVRNPIDFFNRTPEISIIKNTLVATANLPFVIRGERGIGKTSLLNYIQHLLSKENWPDRTFIHFSIEPGSTRTIETFEGEFWAGLKEALDLSGFDVSALDVFSSSFPTFTLNGFAARLRRIWKALPPGLIFGVFLDEIDKTVSSPGQSLADPPPPNNQPRAGYHEIVGLIQHVVEKTDIPVVFFISALRDLPNPSSGSPLSQEEIRLSPFTGASLKTMVRTLLTANGFNPQQSWLFDWFHQYSGGHPYVAKLLIILLLEHYSNDQLANLRPLDLEAIVEVASRHGQLQKLFEDIYWRFLNDQERQVLMLLAQHEEARSVPDELLRAAIRLVRREYLLEDEGRYSLRVGLMRAWLQAWKDFPFELERLQSLGLQSESSETPTPKVFTEIVTKGICVDLDTQRVYIEGQPLTKKLSHLQYKALTYLAERSGKVISKSEIATYIYPGERDELAYAATERVYALINRLKHTLGKKPNGQEYLENVRGSGYRLEGATLSRTLS